MLAGLIALRLGGPFAGSSAALQTGVCVTLVPNAIYALSEPFTSLLVLALLALFSRPQPASHVRRLAASGLLVGPLVATRVTFRF